jgi:hypothetical protein
MSTKSQERTPTRELEHSENELADLAENPTGYGPWMDVHDDEHCSGPYILVPCHHTPRGVGELRGWLSPITIPLHSLQLEVS